MVGKFSFRPLVVYQLFYFKRFFSVAGHGGSRAAEYLKEHLFENLMKHPEFMTNTKLAISMILFLAVPLASSRSR